MLYNTKLEGVQLEEILYSTNKGDLTDKDRFIYPLLYITNKAVYNFNLNHCRFNLLQRSFPIKLIEGVTISKQDNECLLEIDKQHDLRIFSRTKETLKMIINTILKAKELCK